MCLWLLHLQSFHQPAVLLRRYLPHLLLIPRQLVNAAFQTLVQQDEAVLLPIQTLDPIPPPSAEQKQRIREGVEIEFLLNQGRKTVDAFSQICVSAGDEYTVGSHEVI